MGAHGTLPSTNGGKAMESYEEYRKKVSAYDSNEPCPVKETLEIFQRKWAAEIIFELTKADSLRTGELQRRLGTITNTMLSSVLKDLEAKGIVSRKQFNEIPPHVEYSLSDAGKNMYPVFEAMAEWGVKYLR